MKEVGVGWVIIMESNASDAVISVVKTMLLMVALHALRKVSMLIFQHTMILKRTL